MARDSHGSASDIIPLLEGLTVADLEKVIAAAQQSREARRESGKKALVEEFRAKAEALGLSLEDLVRGSASANRPPGKTRQPRKGAPAAPSPVKYRNPDTGETWSGRGRMPKWLALAERAGTQPRGVFGQGVTSLR